MAAKFGRGAVLKVAAGTASPGVLGTPTATFSGLQDVTIETGTPNFVDTTNHSTPFPGTSRTPTNTGEGQLTATIQYDGTDATHAQAQADQELLILKTFSLHDSTTGAAPGKRWRFNGYFGGLPKTLPVSGIATAQMTISIEAGWLYEDDV
jgi:hypothetical protein